MAGYTANSEKDKTYDVYPDPLASNAVKDSEQYGIEYGRFIENDWLYGNDNSRYIRRKAEFSYYESLRDNTVNINKFKDILGINQDKAWTAIDWSFVPIIPKFIDTIVDGFPVELFKPLAEGVDYASQKERQLYRDTLETEMLSQDFAEQFSDATGVDFTSKVALPESSEELDLHMELNYQQDKEVAAEICIDKVLKDNFWDETFNHVIQDMVVFGVGAVRNEIDKDKGIVQRYVNPKHMIYSYDDTYTRDKRGCYYYAEVKILTVEEVNRQSNGKFTPEELKAIANNFTGRLDNEIEVRENNFYDFNVEVIKFCFKTTRNEVYKKKYKGNIVGKTDDWILHPASKSQRLEGTYDVWYEGNYIAYSEFIYGYQLMKDQVRPMSDVNKVLPPYTVYEINTPSMVKRMEKFANEIQITVLKLQQLIATAKPQGALIDIDALTDLNMGTGGLLDPIQVLDIYNQRGDLLYSSKNYDGERITVPPIQELANGIGQDLQQLINYYNQNLQMLYDVTGVNRVRDGSSNLTNQLVGTQQLALSQSNNATKHILNGAMNILKNVSEVIISRIQQMRLYGMELNRGLKSMLGERNVEVLQEANHLHLYEFSITIEVDIDEEERQEFNRLIEVALNNAAIEVPDVIDLKATKNLKLASEYLKLKINKRKREMQMMREREIQIQADAQAQAQIAVEQAKAEAAQMKMQEDQARLEFETRKEALLMGKKYEFDTMMENLRFQHELALKQLEVQSNKDLNKFKEDAKDNRTYKQAAQQSKMIDQRNKNMPAIDFEAQARADQLNQQQQLPNEAGQQLL